jgi:hypothetical protein
VASWACSVRGVLFLLDSLSAEDGGCLVEERLFRSSVKAEEQAGEIRRVAHSSIWVFYRLRRCRVAISETAQGS